MLKLADLIDRDIIYLAVSTVTKTVYFMSWQLLLPLLRSLVTAFIDYFSQLICFCSQHSSIGICMLYVVFCILYSIVCICWSPN